MGTIPLSKRILAKSIAIEAGELLECFQWSESTDRDRVLGELADVLTYGYLLAQALDAEPETVVLEKLEQTRGKYPVDKARGRSPNLSSFSVETIPFTARGIEAFGALGDEHLNNWPVVYTLSNGGE